MLVTRANARIPRRIFRVFCARNLNCLYEETLVSRGTTVSDYARQLPHKKSCVPLINVCPPDGVYTLSSILRNYVTQIELSPVI